MTRLQKLAEENQQKALRQTRVWVDRFSEKAEARVEKTWLLPKALVDAELALHEVFDNYDIRARDLNDLAQAEGLEQLLKQKVPVQRVYGWVGYFWWEFYQDLQADFSIRRCQNCGGIISGGRKDRKYCSRTAPPPLLQGTEQAGSARPPGEGKEGVTVGTFVLTESGGLAGSPQLPLTMRKIDFSSK